MKRWFVLIKISSVLIFLFSTCLIVAQETEFENTIIDIRSPISSCETIFLPVYHPVNLFDKDNKTVWKSTIKETMKHVIDMHFLKKMTIDEIIFIKPVNSAFHPIGNVDIRYSLNIEDQLQWQNVKALNDENKIVIRLTTPAQLTMLTVELAHEGFKKDSVEFLEIEFFLQGKKIEIDPALFLERGIYY